MNDGSIAQPRDTVRKIMSQVFRRLAILAAVLTGFGLAPWELAVALIIGSPKTTRMARYEGLTLRGERR